MKIGYFGARSDSRGLARQSEGFCRHLPVDRIYGLDLTVDDLSPYPTNWSGYDQSRLTVTAHSDIDECHIRHWLRGLDVVLGAETFYRDEFYTWATQEGVRTVLQINPEFSHWHYRGKSDPRPDLFIVPSTWRRREMRNVFHLPFPIDRAEFPFRLRTRADHFVHLAGHRASGDRAGTKILLTSLPRLHGINLTVRTQSGIGVETPHLRHFQVVVGNLPNPQDLYADADVIVLPRRYGGQSLMVNEALSSGCPVIMLDREPENTWGGVLTVPGRVRGHLRTKGGMFPLYDIQRGECLSSAIKMLRDNPAEVEKLSREADEYAQSISWDVLHDRWMELLWGVRDGYAPNGKKL